jgi:hypothetical protein
MKGKKSPFWSIFRLQVAERVYKKSAPIAEEVAKLALTDIRTIRFSAVAHALQFNFHCPGDGRPPFSRDFI